MTWRTFFSGCSAQRFLACHLGERGNTKYIYMFYPPLLIPILIITINSLPCQTVVTTYLFSFRQLCGTRIIFYLSIRTGDSEKTNFDISNSLQYRNAIQFRSVFTVSYTLQNILIMTTKSFLLYHLRWQCSTPIFILIGICLSSLPYWNIIIISNIIGATVFYPIDKFILKK